MDDFYCLFYLSKFSKIFGTEHTLYLTIEGKIFFKEVYQVNINQSHRVMGTKEID